MIGVAEVSGYPLDGALGWVLEVESGAVRFGVLGEEDSRQGL